MSVPKPPRSRTELILDLVREMVPQDPAGPYPDLAEVDGTFYWRACRQDFVSDLEEMIDFFKGIEETQLAANRPDWLTANRREWLSPDQRRWLNSLVQRWEPELPELHSMILLAEPRFRLRDTRAWIGHLNVFCDPLHGRRIPDGPAEERRVTAFIQSPAARGKEVEDQFRRLVAWTLDWDNARETGNDVLPTGTELVRVSARFLDSPVSGKTSGPSIEVMARLPLPPEGLVADIVDRLVTANGWRERLEELTGAANGQEPRTAIRTWAIGLLHYRNAVPYQEACRLVLEALGDARTYLERSQFYPDRDLLVERVPQARPFLTASGR